MKSAGLRLLVADGHVIFTDALRVYLDKIHSVVGTVYDGRTLVEEAIRLRPDAIITEVAMPGLNGLEAARRIRKQTPLVKFIFLSMHDDLNLAAAALDSGGTGFVPKQSPGAELLEAIAHAALGKTYVTPKLRSMGWVERKERAAQFSKEMTARQKEVVQLLAEGRSVKQAAGVLNLSEKTIEFHKHRIMQSHNLRSNADLVLFAVKRGMIPIPD